MIPDITWGKLTPQEMRELIEPYIERYAWLIPSFIHELHVRYFDYSQDEEGKPTDHVASVNMQDDYRRVLLDVYSCWMDGEDRERRYHILHELCHLHTTVAVNFFRRSLDTVYPTEKSRGIGYNLIMSEGRRHTEQATQELAWVLLNLEDSLAEQFGTDNIIYNLTLFTEYNRQKKAKIKIQPRQSENDRSKAADVIAKRMPALAKNASPEGRARRAARNQVEKDYPRKGGTMKPKGKGKAK